MMRSLLAAVMTCALVFSFVGCAEEKPAAPEVPAKPPVVDTKKAADKAEDTKKEAEEKADEAKEAGKKLLEGVKK